MNAQDYCTLIDNMSEDCHCRNQGYCLFKEIIIHSHKFDPRFLVQTKLVEIFKYELSREEEREIGWSEAYQLWVEKGYAKLFADHYKETLQPRTIYNRIKKDVQTNKD